MERRVERAGLQAEDALRERVDFLGHAPAMDRRPLDGLQDQHVERALYHVAAYRPSWDRSIRWGATVDYIREEVKGARLVPSGQANRRDSIR